MQAVNAATAELLVVDARDTAQKEMQAKKERKKEAQAAATDVKVPPLTHPPLPPPPTHPTQTPTPKTAFWERQ